ncbi:MAG: ABC transporter substrate-binding protein [Eubacteriales bacterium]|nr:ABC transporter substrate-binding protein [Eubacteriales bacterium]MDD4390376.1 ABC transporter substrate-binding protein [Eubacteriales bacterium]
MKKNLSLFLILVLTLSLLAGCGNAGTSGDGDVTSPIKVSALNGPTGVGLAPLMEDERFEVTVYQSPDEITGKIITGETDIAAIPSNLAPVLYNKTEGDIVILSTITMGVLYLVDNQTTESAISDFSDLDGMNVIASGKGGVPEYVMQKLIEENDIDVNIEWLGNHTDVMMKMKSSAERTVALLPEPMVTIMQSSDVESKYTVLDVNSMWKDATGEQLPMGVLVAQKSFVEERADDLNIFLQNADLSVKTVNEASDDTLNLLVEKNFFKSADIANAAIPNCNIVFYTDDSYIPGLKTLFRILFEINPKALGGALPDSEIYYTH